MGSFDSSTAAGFTTKALFAKQLTATVNKISVGLFVNFSLTELATLATFRPVASQRTTDHGPRTMKNVRTAVNVVSVVTPFASYLDVSCLQNRLTE